MDTSESGSEKFSARSRLPDLSHGAVVDNTDNGSEWTISIARSVSIGSERSMARSRSRNRRDGASVDNTGKHLLEEEKSETGGGEEDKMEEEKSDLKANGVNVGGTDVRSRGLVGGARKRRRTLSPQVQGPEFSPGGPTPGSHSYHGAVRRVRPDPPTPALMALPKTTTMTPRILLVLRKAPRDLEHQFLPPGPGTLNRPSPGSAPSPSASGPIVEPGTSIRVQGPPNSSEGSSLSDDESSSNSGASRALSCARSSHLYKR